ncbi:MAG: tetratricopeptide repeat protein [Burkholderiales bacterium]|nr:tetratricopeptide repeat protein [Burkholderiales bacterium]
MSLFARLASSFGIATAEEPAAALEQAIALLEGANAQAAAAICAQVLARRPHHAPALHLAGLAALALGDAPLALARIRAAIAAQPDSGLYHFNEGNARVALEDTRGAAACFGRAVALEPARAAAWFNLGEAEFRLDHPASACEALRRALELAPGEDAIALALGRSLIAAASRGELPAQAYAQAVQLIEPRWALAPDPGQAHLALAYALQESGELTRAASHYEAILSTSPDEEHAHNNLANCYNLLARRDEAARHYREVLRLAPGNALAASALASAVNYDAAATPAEVLAAHRDWAQRFAAVERFPAPPARTADPDRRLRIGYVSPDLRRHLVASMLAPVIDRHERGRFEVFCYYNYPSADAVTERLRRSADAWRDIAAQDDEAVARRVREDAIDILVDLAGHTSYGRLRVFARKPAPVQVSWLGYFNTTGLEAIDAFVSDPHSSPPGQERWFTEELVRLPHTRFVFEPNADYPEVGPSPALARGQVSFGCFNNAAKLNARVLALWARLLQMLPQARLVLQTRALSDADNRERFRTLARAAGLPDARLELRPFAPLAEAFRAYHEIDIALDPFPFCGGMTSFDALWMGVPVVTLAGEMIPGRQTASMLHNLGATDWIAADEASYLEIALRLAQDSGRLAAVRAGLRERVRASPLCDYERFTRALECSLLALWRRRCARVMAQPRA